MKTCVDARLRLEIARFGLVFTCEACAHFEPESGACSSGYPNAAHRDSAIEQAELEFCKEFELA